MNSSAQQRSTPASESPPADKPKRLVSLDAYRGFIMITLAAGGFGFAATAKNLGYGPEISPDSVIGQFWQMLVFHSTHPKWNSQFGIFGCSYWDLIQPSFMFMVGVAMPYSYARRQSEGQEPVVMWRHAIKRAIILVLLGVFLQSRDMETNWIFTNVLSQIGLGYLFLFSLLGMQFRTQLIIAAVVLTGYWLAFAVYPAPTADFDFAAVNSDGQWVGHGLFSHFIKNTDMATSFDGWLLNLFPRSTPFELHSGGYATLNFVPSTVTMLFGVMSGQLLRGSRSPNEKFRMLVYSGVICMVLAVAAGFTICPIIKRNWTPSWTLFSGAWVLWLLAVFYWVIDVRRWKKWSFPLVVVGMNSIAIYFMGALLKPWAVRTLKIHWGQELFVGDYGPTVQAVSVAVVFWLFCFWMYRMKIFIRI